MVNYVWKFPNFCYHGNRGCLTQISLTQLNFSTPKTPIWCKNLGDISDTSWVMAYFLKKFANFCSHGNKGGSCKSLNDSVWLALPPNRSVVQNSGTYLKCELSYCDFCVEISKFLLPWQQGLSDTNFTYTLNQQTSKTPYLAQESWSYLLPKLSNGRFFVAICQFLLPWQQEWV